MNEIQVLINSLINAGSLEALKNQLVPALTAILQNGGSGGGITAITSTDDSISIDNADPSQPDLSTGFVRNVFVFNIEQNSATLQNQINNVGGAWSLQNDSNFVFTLKRTGGDSLTGVFVGFITGSIIDGSSGLPVVSTVAGGYLEPETTIQFNYPDGSALLSDGFFPISIIIDYYPNGFDA